MPVAENWAMAGINLFKQHYSVYKIIYGWAVR